MSNGKWKKKKKNYTRSGKVRNHSIQKIISLSDNVLASLSLASDWLDVDVHWLQQYNDH